MKQIDSISSRDSKLVVKGKPVEFSIPIFHNYLAPKGFLDEYLESHALFYYYLCAMRTYEEYIKSTPIVYEGDDDPEVNFRQIFESIARMYQVSPSNMANAWPQVNMQVRALAMEELPKRYRFNDVIRVS